jgi:ATP adenylyltransferase
MQILFMERIFAPWRIRYVLTPKATGCVFCSAAEGDEREMHVVYKGETCFVTMNRHPYNPGHVMVSPKRHVPSTEDLQDSEMLEIMKLVNLSMKAIRHLTNPDGSIWA